MFASMTSNNSGLFVPVPQPPRMEELYTERTYLLNNIQQENYKVTDLLRKLPALEEVLGRTQSSTIRRRTRKQIGWLRYRINEGTRQERTVLNRLSQLGQEIRSRERWSQMENEQRQYGSPLGSSFIPLYEIQQMCISPVTPRACQEYPFPYVSPYVPPPQHQQTAEEIQWRQSFHHHLSEMPSDIFSPVSPQTTSFPRRISQPHALSRVLGPACANSGVRVQRSASMGTLDKKFLLLVAPKIIKRHSTGPTSTDSTRIWSDDKEDDSDYSRDESLESSTPQYSGYYLNR